jgi:hypothetical protein
VNDREKGLGLVELASWQEGEIAYYLHASPAGPGGRVVVLTAVGPEREHRFVVLPQGHTNEELEAKWESSSDDERTRMAESLLPRGRSA